MSMLSIGRKLQTRLIPHKIANIPFNDRGITTKPSQIQKVLKDAERLANGQIKNPREISSVLQSIHQYGINFERIVSLERPKYLSAKEGFSDFVRSLEVAYNLPNYQGEGLNWIDIKPQFIGNPKIQAKIAKNTPSFGISLYPHKNGIPILKDRSIQRYHAPLLLNEVSRWELEKDKLLGSYPIRKLSGVEESSEILDQERNLKQIIENTCKGIDGQTPVVEVTVFIPVSESGEFEAQFVPSLESEVLGHNHYKYTVVREDRLSSLQTMSQGQSLVELKEAKYNPDNPGSPQLFYSKADFVPGLSSIDKNFLNSQTGRLLIIAEPYENPKPRFDFGNDMLSSGNKRGLTYGDNLKGFPSIGSARISTGSKAGSGRLFEGEINSSKSGNPIIYSVTILCVKPNEIRADGFEQKLQALITT
ncbi:MAG: hypothetical protein QNJ31_08995 [Candidatus Caenarcaniphilales bacterium]|nr:hypothetical protein [Candidatus Caenarcaniphilales bacterium]